MKLAIILLLFIFPLFSSAFAFDTQYLNLPSHKITDKNRISIAHRFYGNISKDPLLGIDAGANVDLGFGSRYSDRLDFGVVRSRTNKEYFFSSKFNLIDHETFGMAFLIGGTYKSEPAITKNKSSLIAQFIAAKTFFNGQFLLSIIPTFATAARPNDSTAPSDTAAVGFAYSYIKELDFSYFESVELTGEYITAFYGYGLIYPTLSFGLKLKTWGHYFTLLASNSFSTLPSSYIVGTSSPDYHFGFNIAREF